MMKKIYILWVILFFLFINIYNVCFSWDIKDASGEKFTIKKPQQRIISLAPSITENIYLLGAGDKIVGNTTYCDVPEDAKKKEKVGTYIQPNIEKIVALTPDLVFIPKEGMRKEFISKLRDLGIVVFVFDVENNFKSLSRNFLILAKILGKEKEGNKILSNCKERLNKVKVKVKNLKSKKKIFWQINAPVLITSSGNTLQGEMIRLAGAINMAEDSKINYPRYSKEEIIKQNPDAILIIDMGIITKDEMKKWKNYKNLKAVRTSNIYSIDANLVSRPVPTRFVSAVEAINRILY